jgi:hypothetical protein
LGISQLRGRALAGPTTTTVPMAPSRRMRFPRRLSLRRRRRHPDLPQRPRIADSFGMERAASASPLPRRRRRRQCSRRGL